MELHFRFGLLFSLAIWDKWYHDATSTSIVSTHVFANVIDNMDKDMIAINPHIICTTTVEEAQAFRLASLEEFKKL